MLLSGVGYTFISKHSQTSDGQIKRKKCGYYYLHPAATGCSPEIGFCSHDYSPFLWSSARGQQFWATSSMQTFQKYNNSSTATKTSCYTQSFKYQYQVWVKTTTQYQTPVSLSCFLNLAVRCWWFLPQTQTTVANGPESWLIQFWLTLYPATKPPLGQLKILELAYF